MGISVSRTGLTDEADIVATGRFSWRESRTRSRDWYPEIISWSLQGQGRSRIGYMAVCVSTYYQETYQGSSQKQEVLILVSWSWRFSAASGGLAEPAMELVSNFLQFWSRARLWFTSLISRIAWFLKLCELVDRGLRTSWGLCGRCLAERTFATGEEYHDHEESSWVCSWRTQLIFLHDFEAWWVCCHFVVSCVLTGFLLS